MTLYTAGFQFPHVQFSREIEGWAGGLLFLLLCADSRVNLMGADMESSQDGNAENIDFSGPKV